MDPPANTTQRILVVDDDVEIGKLLSRYLGGQGFEVVLAHDGAQLRASLAEGGIDLMLLDLGLPDEDGLSLLRQFRQNWSGPVIVISGRGDSVEKVIGLELGADDYVGKPFELRELLARIRSVLRRATPANATAVEAAPPANARLLRFEDFELDLGAHRLQARGEEVRLTSGEFRLLKALLEKPNEVLSRDELMNAVHGRAAGPFDRAIDVQLGRLRKKLGDDAAQPRLIKAVRGEGYLFTAAVRRG
jgi:two-component system OmpR family response regulator